MYDSLTIDFYLGPSAHLNIFCVRFIAMKMPCKLRLLIFSFNYVIAIFSVQKLAIRLVSMLEPHWKIFSHLPP